MVLFIDAGHGGWDGKKYHTFPKDGKMTFHPGKQYHNGGWFFEGQFDRDFAAEFTVEATQKGHHCIPVYLPMLDSWRSYNYSDPKKSFWQKGSRCDLANEIWERIGKPQSLLLSFHSNSATIGTAPQNSAAGVCSFVHKLNTPTSVLAEKMTLGMQGIFDKYGSKRRAKLVHTDSLDMTAHSDMPSILFEIGFFDNPQNADLLIKKEFRAELIEKILDFL